MPNPTARYLCSQLASGTKGLCKPLPPANRFFPTSEEAAAAAAAVAVAAPVCLSAGHAPKQASPPHFLSSFHQQVPDRTSGEGDAEELTKAASEPTTAR